MRKLTTIATRISRKPGRSLTKKQGITIDTIGIQALKRQVSFEKDGHIVLPENIVKLWSAGDFAALTADLNRQANMATDNITRTLLAANDLKMFNEVKARLEVEYARQTVHQWTTQVQIGLILRNHGLPVRSIEAIRTNLGKNRLLKLLRDPQNIPKVQDALVHGEARKKFIALRHLIDPKKILIEDIVSAESTPDLQYEQYILNLFKKLKPKYSWEHIGKNKHSEMGVDIIGESTASRRQHKIGIQVKCYEEGSYISIDDWKDFLAGCTLHRVTEAYFITTGRIAKLIRDQSMMAGISLWTKPQVNDQANLVGMEHFEL